MTAFVNLTLNTKVFTPDGNTAGTAIWKNRASGFVGGFLTATAKLITGGNAKNAAARVRLSLKLPVVATESSACSCIGDVLYSNTAYVEFQLAAGSSVADRTALLTSLKDMLATTTVSSLVQNLEPVY